MTRTRSLLVLASAALVLVTLTIWTAATGAAGGRTPSVTLTSYPSSTTTWSDATFTWNTKAAHDSACSLDGAPATECGSPMTFTRLAVGTHTFAVKVSNKWGTATVTMDWKVVSGTLPPPSLELTSQPVSPTTSPNATFAWTATNASSASCSLDGGQPTTCASPRSYNGLGVGKHTFVVEATGSGGKAQVSSAWEIVSSDPAPPPKPTVSITTKPSDPTTATSASFGWTATDSTSFTCKLDAGAASACTSPKSYSGLALGGHTFVVTATGPGGSTQASATWTVSSTPTTPKPTVTITSKPSDPTSDTSASFAWNATDATSYTCKLDAGAATACTSPKGYTGLAVGAHTFVVTASGPGGSTPASANWTVAPAPPPPPPSPPGVSAPTPPSDYSIPAGAVEVATSAALESALAGATKDIVLADGVYDRSGPFTNTNGHRIYAKNRGKAVLQTGMVLGGNYGANSPVIRGLVFDVSSGSKAMGGGIVHVWGASGANASVLDCVFRGNASIPYGLLALNPSGLKVERSQFFNFTDVGLRLSDNVTVGFGSSTPVIEAVRDVFVDTVTRATPGSSNGTAEAGLMIGHPVANPVDRVKVRNVSWSGLLLVSNAWRTTYRNLDIDMTGPREFVSVGVYLEHYSYENTFEQFAIAARTGFNAEWADPAWGGRAAARATVIRSGVVDASAVSGTKNQAGVYLDEGTDTTSVSGVTFRSQNWAGVGAYKNVGTNSFSGNTFQLDSGATPIKYEHI